MPDVYETGITGRTLRRLPEGEIVVNRRKSSATATTTASAPSGRYAPLIVILSEWEGSRQPPPVRSTVDQRGVFLCYPVFLMSTVD
jgi:hypothetical protein